MKRLFVFLLSMLIFVIPVGQASAATLNLQGPGEFWFEMDKVTNWRDFTADYVKISDFPMLTFTGNSLSINNPGQITQNSNQIFYANDVRFFKIALLDSGIFKSFTIREYPTLDNLTFKPIAYNPFDFKPDKVTTIVATPLSKTSIRINWDEPSNITNYDGVKISAGDLDFTVLKGTTELTVDGLLADTRYDFKIQSFNTSKNLLSDNQSFFAITTATDTPPGEIRNLKSFVYDNRIKFTWENPADVDFHEVRIYRGGLQIATAVTPANSFTDYDLDEHTTYTFVFYSANSGGVSSHGISVTETTKGKPRGTVQGVNGSPNDGKLEVYFADHPEATSYNVYLNGTKVDTFLGTSGTLSSLVNGTIYKVQVSAVNEWGESELSDPVNLMPEKPTPPDKPNVKYTATSDSITFSWNTVKFATGYKVFDEDKQFVEETPGTSYTMPGLAVGDEKTIFVSAVNDLGESEMTKATGKVKASPSFSNLKLPFTVPDMLKTAVNFLTLYGHWVLLALGVIFVPVFLAIVTSLIGGLDKDKKSGSERSRKEREGRQGRYAGMSKEDWEKFKKEEIERTNKYYEKTGRTYRDGVTYKDGIPEREQRERRSIQRSGRSGRPGRIGRVGN